MPPTLHALSRFICMVTLLCAILRDREWGVIHECALLALITHQDVARADKTCCWLSDHFNVVLITRCMTVPVCCSRCRFMPQ